VAEVRVELFGSFRVSVGGRLVSDVAWRRRKPAAVVKLLALAAAHRLHREQIMDVLWPDLDPAAAGANLRKAVYYARRALDSPGQASVICSDADLLWLSRQDLWLDVDAFRSAAASGRRDGDLGAYERAVGLYREGLLPEDRYESWASEPRDELRVEYRALLEEMSGLLEARGQLDRALEIARRLVAAEPLREESHATLIRLNALAGRRGDALRAYANLSRLLDEELGTEPGPDLQRLVEEVRAHRTQEPELTTDLWERVGDLRALSGDASGAAMAFSTALDMAEGPSPRVERKCAEAWLTLHRPQDAFVHIEAADVLPADPDERGRLLRVRANHAWEVGDVAAAQEFAERARDLALVHGNADDLAAAHEALAIVSHFRGDWREGLAAEMDRLASEDVEPQALARVFDMHHCIGQYHLYGDGLADSVEDYARRLLTRAEDGGAVRAQAFAWCLLGESLLLQARWDESMGCLERSCELHAAMGSRSGALAWQRRAELAVCIGAFGEAEAYLRRASAIATVSAMASHLWGRIHATNAFGAIERGDPDRAVRAVHAAAAAAARYGDCPTCAALLNPMAAEAFALLGDADAARAYSRAATRVAQMFGSSAWSAMAESAAGSVAAADGDETAARRHFEAARELYERAGQPYWARRSTRSMSATPA
jgi:DNA-binding SARP family transcriptional activator